MLAILVLSPILALGKTIFSIQYGEGKFDVVSGFESVLVLRILVLNQGEYVPELLGFVSEASECLFAA